MNEPIVNFIRLPCGCEITIGRHASCCLKHASELRQLELDNNRRYDGFRAALQRAHQTTESRNG